MVARTMVLQKHITVLGFLVYGGNIPAHLILKISFATGRFLGIALLHILSYFTLADK